MNMVSGSLPTGNPAPGAGGGFVPGGNINASTSEGGSKTLLGDFQATYGQGTGTALAGTLGNLGTATSNAEQLMINPTMQAAERGWGDIQASMGSRGVSADSSTAGLAAGDYWGQVSQGISSASGNIALNEQQQLLSGLTGEGQAHGSDVSGWDQFGDVMKGVGSAALELGGAFLGGPAGAAIGGKLAGLIPGGSGSKGYQGGYFGEGGG
jgi:hypothetical protein